LKALAEADRHSGSGKKPRTPAPSGRSGYFIMPIHGWKSSNFGMRFDPIYRRWQLHAGVDIADPGGTPIHAARAGRVVRAGWFGGYGNYTCVDTGLYAGAGADHGKEIANCYGHQSRIMVHVGQHVRTGR
jgi:murein DD-endopeptidase MepM/ murein hydrolase activator NlpD